MEMSMFKNNMNFNIFLPSYLPAFLFKNVREVRS